MFEFFVIWWMATGSKVSNRWSHCTPDLSEATPRMEYESTHWTDSLHPNASSVLFGDSLVSLAGKAGAVHKLSITRDRLRCNVTHSKTSFMFEWKRFGRGNAHSVHSGFRLGAMQNW